MQTARSSRPRGYAAADWKRFPSHALNRKRTRKAKAKRTPAEPASVRNARLDAGSAGFLASRADAWRKANDLLRANRPTSKRSANGVRQANAIKRTLAQFERVRQERERRNRLAAAGLLGFAD